METRAASASREYQARKRSFVTVFLVAAGIAAGWCGFSLLYGDAPWALPVTLFFSVFLFIWPLIARVLMELVFAHGLQPARAGDAAERRHSA